MKYFLFILSKIIFVPLGIVLSPLLYVLRRPSKVWNINQDLPYDLPKPFWYIWGNMEDGVFFDPVVYKKLGKKFKRGSFRDFFEWNIIRNPTHNLELFFGIDLKDLLYVKGHVKSKLLGKKSRISFFKYELIYVRETKVMNYIEGGIYLPFNRELEFYFGPRLHEIIHMRSIELSHISKEFLKDLKNKGYKYTNNRGYPRVRFGIAFRLKHSGI